MTFKKLGQGHDLQRSQCCHSTEIQDVLLTTIEIFVLILIIHEIFTKQIRCQQFDLEYEGQGGKKLNSCHSIEDVRFYIGDFPPKILATLQHTNARTHARMHARTHAHTDARKHACTHAHTARVSVYHYRQRSSLKSKSAKADLPKKLWRETVRSV